ncbi:MAG TPA: glucose-6-phosphate isomerase [Myxococcota bacterium]|jgi:glucose-6-phosphate isomerase
MTASTRDIRLELGAALAPPLPAEHGLSREEILAALPRLAGVVPRLLGDARPSGFLRALERPHLQREIAATAKRLRGAGFGDLVHVGIGGSALGAETLLRALGHPFRNQLPDRSRGGPRVHFVDNVDPDTLGALTELLGRRKTLLHVVSKSGGTVETAAAFQVLRTALGAGKRLRERCVVTTGKGALREYAEKESIPIVEFPEDVGGRFSVFSASGLLTPAIAGVDVAAVVRGAKRFAARARSAPLAQNPAALAAVVSHALAERRGKPINALMPYADALEPLARWAVQLLGESLGKRARADGRSVGPTPLPARGTTDQHSQVQLFVEGPADKLVVFLRVARTARRVSIPGGEPAAYLRGVELGRLLRAEQEGTRVALAEAGRPSITWELPRISGESVGQLFLALMLQTAYQGELYGIDAYDQPGVEAGKLAAFALIGRVGYERRRAELEAQPLPSWRV